MNGRIYDPLLGRFLSADVMVQSPGNLQAYNRYSYVFNNPLSFTDPSGFATISEYEEKIRKEREAGAAARKEAYAKDGFWGLFKNLIGKENCERGGRIIESENAIASIRSHADALDKLAGVKVDVRKLDDVDPGYRIADVGLSLFKAPGMSAGGKFVSGQYKEGAKDLVRDLALTWAAGKLFRAGEGARVETAAADTAENAVSRVATKVDLEASEKLGGHLLEKHVGKTDAELMSRAMTDPTTRGVASSFFDQATAEAAAAQAVESNAGRISTWLADKGSRLTIQTTMETAVGRVVTSEGAAITSKTAQFTLERSAAAPNGYRFVTGYPQ